MKEKARRIPGSRLGSLPHLTNKLDSTSTCYRACTGQKHSSRGFIAHTGISPERQTHKRRYRTTMKLSRRILNPNCNVHYCLSVDSCTVICLLGCLALDLVGDDSLLPPRFYFPSVGDIMPDANQKCVVSKRRSST